jgi:tape measure domain-containing protein
MALELATAYVSIVPETSKVKPGIDKALQGVGSSADTAGQSMGSKLAAGLGSTLKVGALGAGAVAGGLLAKAFSSGMGRLTAIDNAKAKMEGLKYSTEEVDAAMTSALNSVKGTAFSMADAAGLAGVIMASGVKPGQDLERVLKLVADSATISGKSLGDMGLIWGEIAAKGKVQGGDVRQLLANQIPILDILAEKYGVTAEAVSDMVLDGKVSFDDFASAMENRLGGAALKSGDTFSGAMENMKAAFTRFGAKLAEPVFGFLENTFRNVTPMIDTMTESLGPLTDKFGALFSLFTSGNFTADIGKALGVDEDSDLVNKVLTMRDTVIGAFTGIKDSVTEIFGNVKDGAIAFWDNVTGKTGGSNDLSGVAGLFQDFGTILRGVGDIFIWLWPFIQNVWQILSDLTGLIFSSVSPVLNGLASAISGVYDFIVKFHEALGIAAGIITLVFLPAIIAHTTAVITNTTATIINTVTSKAAGAWQLIMTGYTWLAVTAIDAQTAALKWSTIGTRVWSGIVKTATAIQIAFNNAWLFSPIGLIVLGIAAAIAALVAVFVILWKKCDWFRNFWKGLWNGIKSVFGKVWDWLKVGFDWMMDIFAKVGQWFSDVWNNTLKPIWDTIVKVITIAIKVYIGAAFLLLKGYWFVISNMFMLAWNTLIKPAWDLISAGIKLVIDAVLIVWDAMKVAWEAVANFFGMVWESIIKPAWDALGQGIQWVVDNLIVPAFEGIKAGLSAVGDFFNWIWENVIQPAWNALGVGIQWVIDNIVMPAWNAMTGALGALGDFFNMVWHTVIEPVWKALGDGINWVWENVIKVAFEAIKSGLDTLGEWFDKTVGFIGKVWDKIKETIAAPINWVIEHVYNGGIKKAWDQIAKFIGADDLPAAEPIKLAYGGYVRGAGGPRDDRIPAMLSNGEYVLPANTVAAIGVPTLDRLRKGNLSKKPKEQYKQSDNRAHYAEGGLVEAMTAVVQKEFPAMQMTSGLRFTDNGFHSKGQAADFSDGYDSTPTMRTLAGWIADNYAPITLELIHQPFDRNIGSTGDVGDGLGYYGAGTMAEHRNHVHWAVGNYPGEAGISPVFSGSASTSGGGGSRFSPAAIAKGIWNKAMDLLPDPPEFGGKLAEWPGKFLTKMKDTVWNWIKDKLPGGSSGGGDAGNTPFDISAGAEQWRSNVIAALEREGFPATERNVNLTLSQISSESGGNPNIVQGVQDVNSGGNEGVGLLQIIPRTFASNRNPDLPNDRTNPDANISAALRYYRNTYGDDLSQMWGQGHGYDEGGIFPNNTVGVNTSGKPEAVLTNDQWKLLDEFGQKLSEWGPVLAEEMRGIGEKAAIETFGLSGTLADPQHRYWKAAQDIQKSAEEYRTKQEEADKKAAEKNETTVAATEPATVINNNDYSVNINDPQFSDGTAAVDEATDIQNRQIMRNAGRPQ